MSEQITTKYSCVVLGAYAQSVLRTAACVELALNGCVLVFVVLQQMRNGVIRDIKRDRLKRREFERQQQEQHASQE